MKKKLALYLFFLVNALCAQIKIACIGDSITEGFGLANSCTDAYPILLGEMLGEGYEVKNFGITGKCVQKEANDPYWKSGRIPKIKEFDPDIIIVKLGTNDSKTPNPLNWKSPEVFKTDYEAFLDEIKNPAKKQTFYLATGAWVKKDAIGITREVMENGVNVCVKEIAKKRGLKIIDFHTLLENHPEWYCDDIHPNEEGAHKMAEFVYKFLTGKSTAPKTAKIRGKKTEFEGFDRYNFQFRWRDASLFMPKNKAKSRKAKVEEPLKWVFIPNKIIDNDFYRNTIVGILKSGRAVLSIDLESWLGNENSVKWADLPCKHYAKTMNFAETFDVISDGKASFFAINFAAKYPERVNKLVLKSPVFDIVKWSGEKEWNLKSLKQEWRISDEDLANLQNNPADNFKKIEKSKILQVEDSDSADKVLRFLLKNNK